MNFWDSLCASCDAPQEVEPEDRDNSSSSSSSAAANSNNSRHRSQNASSTQGGGASAGGGTGLMGAHAKGFGYRDILFNPDGKLRPPFRFEWRID